MHKKKICMLGYYAVGKTSLVAQFVSQMFADTYQTTVGVRVDKKVVQVGEQEVTLMLWDVAGQEDDAPVNLKNVRAAHGYLLVIDGLRAKTLDAAVGIQQRVEGEIGPRPFLALINKADDRANWQITDDSIAALRSRGWTVVETSAKTGANVDAAFLELTERMLSASAAENDDDA